MRRLVATFLGSILLAAPAVMLACKWSCAEPAALTAEEGCHESPVAAVALTAATACVEHQDTQDQGVPLARVALDLPMLDLAVVLMARSQGHQASILAIGHAFSPPKPPLALRI
jgi:hypothetical protein